MPITTNVEAERHGADAIHLAREGDEYRIYIGEAKTFNRTGGGLKDALKEAVADVVKKHYKNHRKELDLYLFEEYLPSELEKVARKYKNGTLKGVQVHLVCIVTYNSDDPVSGMSDDEKLDCIIGSIRTATQGVWGRRATR